VKRGENPGSAIIISNNAIKLSALKWAENSDVLIIRLFETTGVASDAVVTIPSLNLYIPLDFTGFEIKTLSVNRNTKEIVEIDLLERR
jgi:alpha-mannosidase